jgi:hypothetical protein
MISYKTIKLNQDDKITCEFYPTYFIVKITINNSILTLNRDHSEYKNTLQDLKIDANLSNHQIKKLNYWHYKNYNKLNPPKEYTTKYGRKIIYN